MTIGGGSPRAYRLGRRALREVTTIVTPDTLLRWVAHYNRGRPHTSLGPGIPEASDLASGHRLRHGHCVVATPILGGLHHEYGLESRAA